MPDNTGRAYALKKFVVTDRERLATAEAEMQLLKVRMGNNAYTHTHTQTHRSSGPTRTL